MVFAAAAAKAQAQDYKALRTNTWSVYGQGGVSFATELDYKSVNPPKGTSMSPQVGLGVNYNIRPGVRLGLNYEFSKYVREQRLSDFQSVAPLFDVKNQGITELVKNNGGTVYGKQWTMYHNADITVEFNIMQLWNNRKNTWFNLYAGTGIGMMFANGNTYTIGMGYEEWTDPNNYVGGVQMGDSWSYTSWVKANNVRHDFNSAYIPFVLWAEFDVTPQLTLGAKGQYKALISSKDFAPMGLEVAAITVRYNFLGAK